MLRRNEKWVGPFRVRALLDSCLDKRDQPPNIGSAYLVTKKGWLSRSGPTAKCEPLYVGGITGKSQRFRTRIGDLLADAFGFYNENNRIGHHSGGRHLHLWCREHKVNPLNLYIGWIKRTKCLRCLEFNLHSYWVAELEKKGLRLLNKRTPPQCRKKGHSKISTMRRKGLR
jgi:hypothetical protein